jgi:hypothetical protein
MGYLVNLLPKIYEIPPPHHIFHIVLLSCIRSYKYICFAQHVKSYKYIYFYTYIVLHYIKYISTIWHAHVLCSTLMKMDTLDIHTQHCVDLLWD